jgi:hypothetical protein
MSADAVLLAFSVPDAPGEWYAWCPRCARFHVHSRGEGTRVPHCANDDGTRPDDLDEYRLMYAGPLARKAVRALERRAVQVRQRPWGR